MPIEGMYRTLSATTNPTGKKRLEAGKNGRIVMAKATTKLLEKDLEVVFIAEHTIAPVKVNMTSVDKFRMSRKDFTNGTVLIVQSQSKSHGLSNSQALRLA